MPEFVGRQVQINKAWSDAQAEHHSNQQGILNRYGFNSSTAADGSVQQGDLSGDPYGLAQQQIVGDQRSMSHTLASQRMRGAGTTGIGARVGNQLKSAQEGNFANLLKGEMDQFNGEGRALKSGHTAYDASTFSNNEDQSQYDADAKAQADWQSSLASEGYGHVAAPVTPLAPKTPIKPRGRSAQTSRNAY